MTFSLPLTPDQLDDARSRIRAQGIPVPEADSGSIEIKGVVIEYFYRDGNFTVKVIKKPIYLSEFAIERVIREWFVI